MSPKNPRLLANCLLKWYDRHGRTLPWRSKPDQIADPYRVWLSEIMLQQTTVSAVIPYFQTFISLWPTVNHLSHASLEDILTQWAGLGYYARARNLHKCAQVIANEKNGLFPDSEEELLKLPGVGRYTAAAISAIAFGKPAVVVDGNVERVMARLFAQKSPLPGSKATLYGYAGSLTPTNRPGDYAQALMDLGATICTPRNPACALCPWREHCDGLQQGIAATLPNKTPKPEKATRRGVAFWVERSDGSILLRRRAEKGLLGGMTEIPGSLWQEEKPSSEAIFRDAPLDAQWEPVLGAVRHTFTHFHLILEVYRTEVADNTQAEGFWVAPDRLGDQALPTVMRKIIRLVRSDAE